MPVVMDAERTSRALTRIAHEILEHNRGLADLALVGVRSRGVPIAQRIAADIKQITKEDVEVGGSFGSLRPRHLVGGRCPRRPAKVASTVQIRSASSRVSALLVCAAGTKD